MLVLQRAESMGEIDIGSRVSQSEVEGSRGK